MVSPPSALTTAMRRARLADALAVTAFLKSLGLVMPEGDEAVRRHWQLLWQDNPALKAHAPDAALGWVVEAEGRIVGFFGNIPQVSYFGGKRVRVSSARAWGVAKEFRAETPNLCRAFFGQYNVDLLLISSASAPAGRRCLEFGAARLPQPGYDQILYWVLDGGGFTRAALRKKGAGAAATLLLGSLGGMALNARVRLAGRRPFAALDDVVIARLDELDESFDALWQAKLKEYPARLLACRDAATLRWYFGLGQGAAETRFACVRRTGQLLGYAALVREDSPAIGLRRLKIADMLVLGDDAATVAALLAAAYEYSLARRCHVLELIGLPENVRGLVAAAKPLSRPMATFPFFYKALKPTLVEPLGTGDGWYVTAFDGDTALL
ncbi:MAG: hypothetical protein HYS64_01690 [Rhodospirillales bacterium]|nr:hypothetical protein [Rhodospirillales bacterium]